MSTTAPSSSSSSSGGQKRPREDDSVPESLVADPKGSPLGHQHLSLAWREMGALSRISDRFALEKPLEGLRVACNLHVTKETGALVRCLVSGGAKVGLTGCNNFSTQDPVAAALAENDSVWVVARHGCDMDEYVRVGG